MDQVSSERAELCRCRPPEGLRTPLLVRKSNIEDVIQTEAEVSAAVRGSNGGRAGYMSGVCMEDLKVWIGEATQKKKLVRIRWELVLILLQHNFGDTIPLAELAWVTMTLAPKGRGGCGILGSLSWNGRCEQQWCSFG